MMTTYGLLFTLLWSLGEPLARAAAVEQSFDENCASASRGATVEAFDGRMVEGATSVEDQAPCTFPSQKMSAIFPGSSVPPDLKESWQQHLMEQFTSLRGSDDADVPSAADCASPSTMDRHVSDSSPSSNDDRRRDARFQGDFGAGEEDALDDRTILDVFGEAAKEFLTQRVVRTFLNLFRRKHCLFGPISYCVLPDSGHGRGMSMGLALCAMRTSLRM